MAVVLDREQWQRQQQQTETMRLRGPFTHTHQPSAGELLLAVDVVHPETSPDRTLAACTAHCFLPWEEMCVIEGMAFGGAVRAVGTIAGRSVARAL